jgi:hypothetical protein
MRKNSRGDRSCKETKRERRNALSLEQMLEMDRHTTIDAKHLTGDIMRFGATEEVHCSGYIFR